MKMRCKNCGHENELGHVFCAKCGKKMELSAPEVDHAIRREESHVRTGRVTGWLIVLALAAIVGLALWPQAAGEPGAGEPGVAEAGRGKVGALIALARGGETGRVSISAAEAQAYAARRGSPGVVVEPAFSISGAALSVGIRSEVGPVRLWKVTVGPFGLSRQVSYRAAGAALRRSGARIGHLPLAGPLVGLVAGPVERALAPTPLEKQAMDRVTGVEISEGQIHISVGP